MSPAFYILLMIMEVNIMNPYQYARKLSDLSPKF